VSNVTVRDPVRHAVHFLARYFLAGCVGRPHGTLDNF
jgi:hypothetical protein